MHRLAVPPQRAPVEERLSRAIATLPFVLFQNHQTVPPLLVYFSMHIPRPFGDTLTSLHPRPSLVRKISGTQGCPCNRPR